MLSKKPVTILMIRNPTSHVDDAVEAVVALLQLDEALDRAEIVAEMQVPGRLHAGKHPLLERRHAQ